MLNTLAIEEYNELRCKGEVKIIMRCTTQGREKCKINTHVNKTINSKFLDFVNFDILTIA